MAKSTQKIYRKLSGFTVIEVMIVLAIAGLIMVIVFIAVPQLQSHQRDTYRKDYARRVMAALLEFAGNNQGNFPVCTSGSSCLTQPADAARFLTKYLPAGTDPSTGVAYNSATASPGSTPDCNDDEETPGQTTVFCYDDRYGHYIQHDLHINLGEVIITGAHVCGGEGSGATGPYGNYAIQDLPGGYNSSDNIAVVAGLENGQYYCVSNDSYH